MSRRHGVELYGGVTYACHDPSEADTSDARAAHLLFGCGAGIMLRGRTSRRRR